MTIDLLTRAGKGSALTILEHDENLDDIQTYLNALGNGLVPASAYDSLHTALAAAIAVPGSTLLITGDYTITAALEIEDATRLRITGGGKLTLTSAAAYGFQLIGTCSRIEIDHLTIVGTGVGAHGQNAIGSASGQSASDCSFHDLDISQVAVGISLYADPTGTWTRTEVYNNKIHDCIGTVAGQGYGIALSRATHCKVHHNDVWLCQRHSIYHARGDSNEISFNKISRHREGVAEALFRTALTVSRDSTRILVFGNTLTDCYDGCIETYGEAGSPMFEVTVSHNHIVNPKNAVPALFCGGDYTPAAIDIRNVNFLYNTIEVDASATSAFAAISVYFGNTVLIKGNTIRIKNLNGQGHIGIHIANDSFVSNNAYCDDITSDGNIFDLSGANIGNVTGQRISSVVSGNNGIRCVLRDNIYAGYRDASSVNYFPIYEPGARTNPFLDADDHLLTFRAAAAPASGYWLQGDKVWFTAPAAGGAPGAVCTASGAPGTWKAMASLAA